MMGIKRVGSLEIAEDMALERATWTVQRIGWVALLVIVLLAAAGLCGSVGPLNSAGAGEEGGPVRATYARFVRHSAPTILEVEVGREAIAQGKARIWIDSAYLGSFEIASITPEPESVEIAPDRLTYEFPVGEGDGPFRIAFRMRPEGYWRQQARMGVPDGPTLTFAQFVYP
jgi:hypothetical protein